MLMKKVLALEYLHPVETGDKVEACLAFLSGSLRFVWIHLWIFHGVVPDRDCCARWTAITDLDLDRLCSYIIFILVIALLHLRR